MKYIKKLVTLGVVVCALTAVGADSVPRGFTDDFDAAKRAAAQSGKRLFILFTGSDWCPACKALERNIISDMAFAGCAQKRYELVYVDFPKARDQSPDVRRRNRVLQKDYGIEGYPTILIADAEGRKLVSLYYKGERDVGMFLDRIDAELKAATGSYLAVPRQVVAKPEAK